MWPTTDWTWPPAWPVYTWAPYTEWPTTDNTYEPTTGWPTSTPTEDPTVAPTPQPTPCTNGESFQIYLQEDRYGSETSIFLFSLGGDDYNDLDELVYSKSDFVSRRLYDIPLCLEPDQCYLFAIHDWYGDGLTLSGGYFDLLLEDKKIYKSDGDFGYYDSWVFCTGDMCQDDRKIRFTKEELSCKKFVKGKFSEKKDKCNKHKEGDYVYNHCPVTCAKQAKVGTCSWMRNKEKDMKDVVYDTAGIEECTYCSMY